MYLCPYFTWRFFLKLNITIFKDCLEYRHSVAVRMSQSKTVECASDHLLTFCNVFVPIFHLDIFLKLNITIFKDCLVYRHCLTVRQSQSKTVESESDPLAYIPQCICAHISLGGFFKN